MRHLLNWIKNEYDNPLVYVTENGVSDKGGLNDKNRVEYLNNYLTAIHNAINRDGCNVKGYIAWSLMDSYEWSAGFTEKFGLYHVDFKDPNRKRTPKLSALVFSHIAQTKTIDKDYQPSQEQLDRLAMEIDQVYTSFSDRDYIILGSVAIVIILVCITGSLTYFCHKNIKNMTSVSCNWCKKKTDELKIVTIRESRSQTNPGFQ
jgi:Glycosyl hydrolase family 1